MDVVKPVDSLEPLFASRPSASKKPLPLADVKEPSAFARLLKKKSQSLASQDAPSATKPERETLRAKPDAVSGDLESPPKERLPSPPADSAEEHSERVREDSEAADPASVSPPQPPVVANESLAGIGDSQAIALEGSVEPFTLDASSAADPTVSVAEPEPAPTIQTPMDLPQDIEPTWTEAFPTAFAQDTIETQATLIPVEIEPSLEVATLSETEPDPVADAVEPNAVTSHVNPMLAENPHRIQTASWSSLDIPPSDAVNTLGAQSTLEASYALKDAGTISVEAFDSASHLEAIDLSIPNTEAATDGPDQHATPAVQVPPAIAASARSESAMPDAKAVSSDRAGIGQAEGLANRIGASILQAANGGKALRMRLHPPELGILQIEVSSVQGIVTARLDVESAHAHRAILENLPQLHEMLARTHTQVDRIELNITESRTELEGQPRQFGQSAADQNSPEERRSPGGVFPRDENDSRADRESFWKSRQREDWQSRSLPLSGIDIQV